MSTDSPLNSYKTNPLQTTKHGSNAMPSNKGLHFGRKNGVSCFNSQLCHVASLQVWSLYQVNKKRSYDINPEFGNELKKMPLEV